MKAGEWLGVLRLRTGLGAFALLAGVLAGSLAALHFRSDTRSLYGAGSDHFAHWGQAVLFSEKGFDVYRLPTGALCPIVDSPQVREVRATAPSITFCSTSVEGAVVPFNWPQYPQPYPPGLLLYSAPAALLYRLGGLSFHQVTSLTIMQYLAVALLVWWFYASAWLKTQGPRGRLEWSLRISFTVLFFLESLRWALWGIYDPVAIGLAGVAILALLRHRPLTALLAYSAAVFLHFRALWYFPLVPLALLEWRRAPRQVRKQGLWVCLPAAFMLGLAAYSFALLLPSLQSYPIINRLYLPQALGHPTRFWLQMTGALVILGLLLASLRAWRVALFYAGVVGMIAFTRDTHEWHTLFLFPLFLTPLLERETVRAHAWAILLAFYLAQCHWIFRNGWPPHFQFLWDLLAGTY